MKKFLISVVTATVVTLLAVTAVFAEGGGPPPDYCSNVPGNQDRPLPEHMLENGDGTCSCDSGWELQGNSCVVEPPPPTDLCNNIEGIQDKLGSHMNASEGVCSCDLGWDLSGDKCVAQCKHEDAECTVNESEHVCCPGLTCIPFNPQSGNGKCGYAVTPTCGDGTINQETEQCDDGNVLDGDGCSSTCQNEALPVCGDSVVGQGETCDDGNVLDGDGCSSTCQLETPAACGDGKIDQGEVCDDGNTVNGDGCSSTCQTESKPPIILPKTGIDKGQKSIWSLIMIFAGTFLMTYGILDKKEKKI